MNLSHSPVVLTESTLAVSGCRPKRFSSPARDSVRLHGAACGVTIQSGSENGPVYMLCEMDFEAAARECRPFLLKIAVASARNPIDAEDIVQESLMRAFRGFKRFRGDCPLRVWLSRIVVRVAINHHRNVARRLKRWVFFTDLEAVQDSGDAISFDPPDPSHDIPRERLLDVQKHVNRLPDQFRMPLMMLAVEGLTIPEIAQIMEMPEGTVKSRIFYARKRLKDALDRKKK